MKWQGRRQSDNVDDQRTRKGGGKIAAGGGIIGIVAVLLIMFGGEQGKQIGSLIQNATQGQATEQTSGEPVELTAEQVEMGNFSKTVFADCEDVWSKIFAQENVEYRMPNMVLFSDQVNTACGTGAASMGPFYCPGDEKVYMDLEFFKELKTKFGAKGGDFATAYVIAHEVGHHIQTFLGTSNKMRQAQQGESEAEKNKLSVCLELQADFYAGVFTHYNKQYLEAGDIEEALSAAHAVGDDAIQKRMRGYVEPESFNHGTSEQRKEWFMKGYKSGEIYQGNTFETFGYSGFDIALD